MGMPSYDPADDAVAHETHKIEFSINLDRELVKRLATNLGLTVDPNYSATNGGVTRALKFTGPREALVRFVRRVGYPGQNPELETPRTKLDRLLRDMGVS